MNKITALIQYFVCFTVSLVFTDIQAATFGTYDPRSLAMGGTGVSQANIDHAAYYNPALLSVAQDDDDFSLLVPTIGVEVYDPKKFIKSLQDHQDGNYETAFKDSVTTFEATPSQVNAQAVVEHAQRLRNSLIDLSGKELDLELHAGLGFAIPSKSLGFAAIASGRAMNGVVLNVSEADKALMQEYINAANDFAADGVFNGTYPNAVCGTSFCPTQNKLTSTATIRGAMVIEGGLSLSHEFESLGNWSIGITPKTVQVTTYDYEVAVEDSEVDLGKDKLQYDDTNIDIGIARHISEGLKFGLVVKNAIKKEYKTIRGNTIVLEPAARTGISHHTNWTTIALDIDLTENQRTGLTGEKTRYVALGMEFDLSLVQLRVGARHNLSAEDGRDANLYSAGVGLYIIGVHADLGVARSEDEASAALQVGFQF